MAKNEVRIIGGKWRGRKLKFPDAKGLRPSQDRARETLFNWLAPWIVDARVLDLFAGSGVLGFEALSRGAASAELVDSAKSVEAALIASKALLEAKDAHVYRSDALKFLQGNTLASSLGSQPNYDLVFIDPPFADGLVSPALEAVLSAGRLATDGLIYVELPKRDPLPQTIPTGLCVFRDKTFGDSRALLLEQDSQSA